MPDVVVSAPLGNPWQQGQDRLGAIQRLHLGLLVQASFPAGAAPRVRWRAVRSGTGSRPALWLPDRCRPHRGRLSAAVPIAARGTSNTYDLTYRKELP